MGTRFGGKLTVVRRGVSKRGGGRLTVALLVTTAALISTGTTSGASNAPNYTVPPEFIPPSSANIHEYPTTGFPFDMSRGPDGNVWFGEGFPNFMGRVSPNGTVKEFPTSDQPDAVTRGPDGAEWFTVDGNGSPAKVGKINVQTGAIQEFPVPNSSWLPGITTGPDHNIWYADFSQNSIGKVDPVTGQITEFPVPDGASPFAITAGPDGNLWFTSAQSSPQVGRITPTGVVTLFTVPGSGNPGDLKGITAGPDGNLWFTEVYANAVGKLNPSTGAAMLYYLPTTGMGPFKITAGPDHNMWFTEQYGNRIARITLSGSVTEFHIPTPQSAPWGIAAGADGKIYFTESFGKCTPDFSLCFGIVGSLDPATVRPPPPPCLTVTQSMTLTHDIGPCRGDGIVIKANNVTLNLGGHRILGADRRLGDFAGVHLLGVSGVTVTNGTISGFDAGVDIDFGSANTIRHIRAQGNLGAPDPGSSLGDGIIATHSSGNKIIENAVTRNGIYDGIAVLGLDSNNNAISRNLVKNSTDSNVGASFPGGGTGIIVNAFLEVENPRRGETNSGNAIKDNLVTDNVGPGISNIQNAKGVIRGNDSEHNGFYPDGSQNYNDTGNGIGVRSLLRANPISNDLVIENRTLNNAGAGISVASEANQIRSNYANGNLFADLFDVDPNCDSNVWWDNTWGTGGIRPPCTGNGGHQLSGTSGPSSAGVAAPQAQPSRPQIGPKPSLTPQFFSRGKPVAP